MAILIAFLRAINVGGHNVKMEHLKSLISGYGLSGVETFIASGNVIVDGGRHRPTNVETLLETRLEADLGYPVGTFVRTNREVADSVAAQPFSAAPGRYYLTFLKSPPSADDFAVIGREVHWLVRDGFESRLTGSQPEWAALGPGTTRNVTTVRRLAAKYPPTPNR